MISKPFPLSRNVLLEWEKKMLKEGHGQFVRAASLEKPKKPTKAKREETPKKEDKPKPKKPE